MTRPYVSEPYVSEKMKTIISRLAERESIDLSKPGTALKFEMPGYQPLVIETIFGGLVTVAHTGEQNGDLMYDPEMIFETVSFNAWTPVEFRNDYVGFRIVNAETPNGVITRFDPNRTRDAANFADTWATNIEGQGWLEATCTRAIQGE